MIINDKLVTVENATVMFKNFRGEVDDYNKDGTKNVTLVFTDPQAAQTLIDAGWNIKERTDEETATTSYSVNVVVSYRHSAPKIVLVTQYTDGRQTQTRLFEDTVGELDFMHFLNVDMQLQGSFWEMNGKTGMKAYLKTLYVVVEADPFELKYEIPSETVVVVDEALSDDVPF